MTSVMRLDSPLWANAFGRDDPPDNAPGMIGLDDAVQAAHEAANDALVDPNGLDAFTGAVPAGVSANLC